MSSCKVCSNTEGNNFYQIREMQLGTRELFTYMECHICGCLQLVDVPSDLGKYYPNQDYYSFNLDLKFKKPGLPQKLKSSWLLEGKNPVTGKLLSLGYRVPDYYSWMRIPGIKKEDAILDVGTGNGGLLSSLYKIGYTNLTGIDPFIEREKQHGEVRILKKNIYDMKGMYDYIMLHHAFEHMDEPLKALKKLYSLLNKGKYLLIRTPMMGMYSWKKYKENWMDIDAPRHIIVHTPASMAILAEQAGFEIKKIIYDANYMSLIGSDQYTKDIAVNDPTSYMENKERSGYTKGDIEKFEQTAKDINEQQQGDQASFYLYKKG